VSSMAIYHTRIYSKGPMSRSVHTDPFSLRAARRIQAPSAPRNSHATRTLFRTMRLLKGCGIIAQPLESKVVAPVALPRVCVHPPHPMYHHPASRTDLLQFLLSLGPEYRYKLHSIELCRNSQSVPTDPGPLGRLEIPGRILLYEQPLSPWRFHGLLTETERRCLREAGAVLDQTSAPPFCTVIWWPKHTLRDFMLHGVLLHELCHHLIQTRHAKPSSRIFRTLHHEHRAVARTLAQAARLLSDANWPQPAPPCEATGNQRHTRRPSEHS